MKLRQDEAAKDLELIQVSVSVLWQEKQKFKQQKAKALHWLEQWKSGQAQSANCRSLIGFVEELPQLDEFSLSEIQTATCNFSESFRIGQAGYECMYKGEMMGRTVAISKLHPHSMLQPSEFQREVGFLLCLLQKFNLFSFVLVISHVGWKEERNISYKSVETPSWWTCFKTLRGRSLPSGPLPSGHVLKP